MKHILIWLGLAWSTCSLGQQPVNQGKFEQLGTILPTPNEYRAGSGSPGPRYWQQRADYTMEIELDEDKQRISGSSIITYHNNSPHSLEYLWVQLDQNMRASNSDSYSTRPNNPELSLYNNDTKGVPKDTVTAMKLLEMTMDYQFDGGFKIQRIQDRDGRDLPYTINKTMMRIELPESLQPGGRASFSLGWWYNINDRMVQRGRSGYEYFPRDGNYLFTIAQFYPRMAVYDDIVGWQNKQFLGDGEFALSFGDYHVRIKVPADHIVAATGTLMNPQEVLTAIQIQRLEQARQSTEPVLIVTQSEALRNENARSKEMKTWEFQASNVRDFAFASSRKFIWDAMVVPVGDKRPMAMSFYPTEGNPLWERESTRAVANTLKTYSKYTIDYPYPVAISVHAASIGMEYPMICFNFGRPNADGSYTRAQRDAMIGVIVHEVGHNFFPMIINSDERQWTWMDEGLNSFVQYLTLEENYENYPHKRGPPRTIIPYMKGDKSFIRPIMTNSEQLVQFSANAYAKPATALNILRETVMGRELFDYAFKEYARRWAFKSPSPADFFRTMEDASAVDLDWFWRGWFYGTDYVDLSVDRVRWLKLNSDNPRIEGEVTAKPLEDPGDNDQLGFDNSQEFYVSESADPEYREFLSRLDGTNVRNQFSDKNIYEITFHNNGGLVMPIIIQWRYEDGTSEIEKIPAEIWRYNESEVIKLFVKEKRATSVHVDPSGATADVNTANNDYPRTDKPSRFDRFKNRTE